MHMHAKSLQSCPTHCDPVDCSLPESSVHGILQARILEWVAMPSSRGSSRPRDQIRISCCSCLADGFFTTGPLGKPAIVLYIITNLNISLLKWTSNYRHTQSHSHRYLQTYLDVDKDIKTQYFKCYLNQL